MKRYNGWAVLVTALAVTAAPAFAQTSGYGGLFGAITAVQNAIAPPPPPAPEPTVSATQLTPEQQAQQQQMPDLASAQANAPISASQSVPQTVYGPVDPSAPTVGGSLWGNGTATSVGRTLPGGPGSNSGYCDPDVALQDERMRADVIQGRMDLARREFSLLPAGMLNLSCVDRILNAMPNIFLNNGFQGLLSQFTGAFTCERILRSVNSYANQTISQYVGQGMGMVSRTMSSALPIGQIIPGVSLGSLTGNINLGGLGVNIGGVGSNPSYVNLGQTWNSQAISGTSAFGGNPGYGGGYGAPTKLFGP